MVNILVSGMGKLCSKALIHFQSTVNPKSREGNFSILQANLSLSHPTPTNCVNKR